MPLFSNRLRCGCWPAAWIVFFSIQPAMAQLPAARLNSVFPPGGKQGTTIDVALAGTDLEEATLHFSRPGFSAVPKSGGQFALSIAADVPSGLDDVWTVGRDGISNLRFFAVGELPEAGERTQ